MTDFYKFIKFGKILENIRLHIGAVSPKAYIEALWSIRRWIEHILKACYIQFELMKNCKKDRLL